MLSLSSRVSGIVLSFLVLTLAGPAYGGAGSHKHHIALFGGMTSHHHKTAATVGADYEYRLGMANEMFGVVALVDAAFFDHQALVYGLGLGIHPWGALKFLLAGGQESSDGHKTSVLRMGLAYDFHIGSWSLAPTYNADLLKGSTPAHVIGLSLGIGF